MESWGYLELNIYEKTYKSFSAKATFQEIPLIPNPESINEINSVLQQGSRGRKTVRFTAAVTTLEDYNLLLEDHLSGIVKTFTGLNGEVFEAIIYDLGVGAWKYTFYEYDIEIMEV